MNDYWNGKVAIITGATHGIGLRLAERLSAESGVNKEDRITISQIPIGRRIDRDEITDGIIMTKKKE